MGGWGEVIGGPRVWARDLGLAVVIGVAIAFVGPFGSYGLPLERRILTSVSYALAGSIAFWPTLRLLLRLAARLALPEWASIPTGLVLAAAPVTLAVAGVSAFYRTTPAVGPDLATLYFAVLAIVFPTGVVWMLFARRLSREPSAAAAPAPPRLIDRLPTPLGREVLALQAEDHYVRVHTARGSTLILMRFADAVAELDGLEGLRVHRSWWVARAAVAAVKPEGRRLSLTLVNGIAAPVTREAVPQVRKAGWI